MNEGEGHRRCTSVVSFKASVRWTQIYFRPCSKGVIVIAEKKTW